MSIIDEYISQHFSERLCLDVTEEDITWQLRGSRSDYVNTRIQFDREKTDGGDGCHAVRSG